MGLGVGDGVGLTVAGDGEGEGSGEGVGFVVSFSTLAFSSLTLATSALVFNRSHPRFVGKKTAGPTTFPSFPAVTATFFNSNSSLDASLSLSFPAPPPAPFPKGVFQSGGSQLTGSTTLIIVSARL